jgi:FkbM family methyltransferase
MMDFKKIKKYKHMLYSFFMEIRYWSSQMQHVIGYFKKSYSIQKEDLIVSKYFQTGNGQYIDIGAGHPIYGSNTFLFYKLGWRGICVDPVKGIKRLHRILRPGDKFICGVISHENISKLQNEIMFYEFNPRELSTVSSEQVNKYIDAGGGYRRKYLVTSSTLNDLVLFLRKDLPYFLSVDVEGMDFEVIKQLKTIEFKPRAICIETTSNRENIDVFLESQGYIRTYSSQLNNIYVMKSFIQTSVA